MADESSSKDVVRFEHGRTCPICGGAAGDPRHQGVRCHGFISGKWVHCSRKDFAGSAKENVSSGTFAHLARGACPCGVQHARDDDPRAKEIDATYTYRDVDGVPLYQVVRFRNPKDFRQRHFVGDGRMKWGLPKSIKRVIYRLDRIAFNDVTQPVWIVEGEKDVHRLEEAGLVATTNAMGAGKWQPAYADQLAGHVCYVVPDNDDVGREHARKVASSLMGKATKVKVVELPGLPDHGDVSDFLAGGRRLDELLALAGKAPEFRLDAPAAPDPKKFQSQADAMVRTALERCEFWRTPNGEAFATVVQKGTVVDLPVNSSRMTDWLFDEYVTHNDDFPSPDFLTTARAAFQSRARIHGQVHKAWIRVADETAEGTKDYVFWLDLCDGEGHAVRITARGWEVVKNPPMKFLRPDVMRALPTPERGGSIDELWDFVNVDPADRCLLIAALTAFMRPRGPYPLLVLGGEQGSAKSTSTRVLKRLVDDRVPILGSLPETPLDLWVVAGSNWLLTFDNISSIAKSMSNALCQLALEGGMERRKLHTDAEVSVLEAMRPKILNGIDEFARAPDLVDRVVMLNCPKIGDSGRREEDEVWTGFHQARPRILGALCDAIAGGLKLQPTIRLASKPRMADFATWGEAVCRHLGFAEGEFLAAMTSNRDASSSMALEDSPVAAAIFELGRRQGTWKGTCQSLLTELRTTPGASDFGGVWPRSPRGLASHLRRIQPGLRREGVTIEWPGKVRHERVVEITWASGPACPAEKPF